MPPEGGRHASPGGLTSREAAVSVFAPAPVLTVTIEPSAQAPEVHVHAGGQGAWIANMLAVLEVRTLLCAPLGGEIGRVLEAVLGRDRLELRVVPTGGTNGCYIEDRRSGELERLAETDATELNRHESDDLCNALLTAGIESGVTVLTGPAGQRTVDPDVYRRVSADLTALDVTVVADLSGDEQVLALEGGVAVLKVSHEEVEGADPVKAAEKLRESVRDAVVLTRADQPALVFGEGIRAIRAPVLETVDHRGAGDSFTAGTAAGLARGGSLDDALRLGAAAGAVNVTRRGLASGSLDTIEALAEKVTIEEATKEDLRRARTRDQ